jgi:hypothetical protein
MMDAHGGPIVMNLPLDGPPRQSDVRELWRTTSLAEVWLRPGDWYHPAVDALIEAVEDDRCPVAAAQRLGAARGAAGVGIGEALDDVTCLYRATGRPVAVEVVRATAIGWVQGREGASMLPGVHDPATGLPTGDYLAERLRETYGRVARDGQDVTETHCLLIVDVAVDGLDAWQRMARSAAVGRTLDQIFGDGHPMATMADGIFAVLCERGEALTGVAHSVRRVVERNAEILGLTEALRSPTRVWVERLPGTHDGALQLLRHFVR